MATVGRHLLLVVVKINTFLFALCFAVWSLFIIRKKIPKCSTGSAVREEGNVVNVLIRC